MQARIVDEMTITMRLDQLISGLEIACPDAGTDLASVRICDITEDSRTAVPGSLFIARAGTRDDGLRYVEPAVECGAVAVLADESQADRIELPPRSPVVVLVSKDVPLAGALLAERFYGDPASKLVCAGVTGTNGKTTIAHLAHQMIEAAGVRCGLIGTVEIDDGRERARATLTTPPAVELSRTLATMVEHSCKAVVMEVSSHALDQQRVGGIWFDAAAFTNLTGDHLDYHKTLAHYTASKARLFARLKDDGLAVINSDDAAANDMIRACPAGAQVVRCGRTGGGEAGIEIEDESIAGMTLTLRTPGGELHARVPVFGRYNAMNILQAAVIAQRVLTRAGIPADRQRTALQSVLPKLVLPQGRLERAHGEGDDVRVLVDFAHTDDALASALGAVRAVLPQGAALWCVFGCGGDRDRTKRPRMAGVVAARADKVVITSDNPRTEPPNRIIDEVLAGIKQSDRRRVTIQPDRSAAIHHAITHAAAGDVIVIAGKGHETEQIVPDGVGGTRTLRFDDREHARAALRERRFRIHTPPAQQQGAASS
ncbi:MAG: UDP-N-acetylmuramoyl-L-alanyl-D-glutamate--2,6-diaminopimelate ligase [Phycisphaerales bacterium]